MPGPAGCAAFFWGLFLGVPTSGGVSGGGDEVEGGGGNCAEAGKSADDMAKEITVVQ
jgi:hypothetical protein